MQKNKITIAALLAAVLLGSLTACGSKGGSDSKTETTTTAVSAASQAEETEPAETENTIEKTPGSYADGVFDCEYYSVTVDESKWQYTDGSEMDCQFNFIGKPEDELYSASSLNVASFPEEKLEGITIDDYAEQIITAYKDNEGYEVSQKEAELDGTKGVEITINFPMGDSRMTIKQLVAEKNGAVIAVSYGAVDDVYDKMQKQFDKVIGGIKLK